jgi:hypothetical protein
MDFQSERDLFGKPEVHFFGSCSEHSRLAVWRQDKAVGGWNKSGHKRVN